MPPQSSIIGKPVAGLIDGNPHELAAAYNAMTAVKRPTSDSTLAS
jgi:hypothetical protein